MKARTQRDKPVTSSPASERADTVSDEHARPAVSDSPRQVVQAQRMSRFSSATSIAGGLPTQLVQGVAGLSGEDLSDVHVHRNSTRPAQMQAEAFAQGRDIHLAPGQDRHLPHEAWHVVQQRQGRVRPTGQVGQQALNDDPRLEREADTMGAKALQMKPAPTRNARAAHAALGPVQRKGGRREVLAQQPSQAEPIFVKVIIAGSGYDRWETHVTAEKKPTAPVDTDGKKEDTQAEEHDTSESIPSNKKWMRHDNENSVEEPTHYRRDKDGGRTAQVSFAGPGASTTKDSGPLGGAQDVGSNSIANLVKHVPQVVEELLVSQFEAFGNETPVVILIKAHSRGAVAASRIARQLAQTIDGASVEVVLVDPVPGPLHEGDDLKIDLSGLKELTLVYSVASGYGVGFDPQAVFGAKRIIISQQSHSVGLAVGFNYNGKIYKGSNLNSLPEGVYADFNKTGENKLPLLRVTTIESAREKFEIAFQASEAKKGDSDRREIVKTVLEEYFSRG
jgi:hypothetical protein